jgi:hemoglobin/transferrin/lactoferrin receptor protein
MNINLPLYCRTGQRVLRVILFLFALGFAAELAAQTVTITCFGKAKPIGNVYIFDQEEKKTALTNKKGQADLSSFNDDDTLYFQHPSYSLNFATKIELKKQGYKVQLSESVYNITEFKITTLRGDEEPELLPYTMEVMKARDVALNNPQTSADMLQMSGDVAMQKSQMGGGSPIIRGFEANKILLVVDGVRMNNAIYRSGHLQNAITVDPNVLERTEILFGPGSVVYGSEALGGVVHFHSRNPKLKIGDEDPLAINAMLRFGTVNSERTVHYDISSGTKKFGTLTSFTASDFGDLRMGRVRPHGHDDWGLIQNTAGIIDGKDTMLVNENPNIHKRTAYQQIDFMQKFLWQPKDSLQFILNMQYSTSSNVPRFDRLNQYSDGALKFSEWYYGPQQRWLSSLKTSITSKSKLFNVANFIVAYQNIDEDRVNRKLGSDTRTYRFEDVDVYSFNADFVRGIDSAKTFYYGLESTFNDVRSNAHDQDINTSIESPSQTRYPDGGAQMQTHAAYVNYNWQFTPLSTLNVGMRYSHATLNADFTDNTFIQLPFDNISFNNGSLTGSIGYTFRPTDAWKITAITSSGYRNPNVDDFGKVFEKDGFVVIPNNLLKPEYAYNGEVSLSKKFFRKSAPSVYGTSHDGHGSQWLQLIGSVYYTYLIDAIVRQDWRLNDSDSALYEGEMARVQTNLNAAEAVVYGYNVKAKLNMTDKWALSSSYNYTYGENLSDSEPLAHIPPTFGRTAVSYSNETVHIEFYSMYNAAKDSADYGSGTTDNLVQATPEGTPAWYTLNFKSTFTVKEALQLQFALENILDHHYKPFASGISAPGRNFMVTLRAAF